MSLMRAGRLYLFVIPMALMLSGCFQERRFVVNIERYPKTEEEEALIDIAEHFCPPREDVLALAYPEDCEALEAEAGDGCLWWYYGAALRIPYAITADSVDYYVQEIDRLRRIQWMIPSLLYPAADLHYSATIEFVDHITSGEKQFENVYIVHMALDYSEAIAFLAGGGFSKERMVLLTPEGDVLATFGDGATDVFVI